MKTKYKALRAISLLYKILSLLILLLAIFGIIINFGRLLRDDNSNSFSRNSIYFEDEYDLKDAARDGAIALVVGGLIAVSIYATGEHLDVLIDTEENTRATRTLLLQMGQLMVEQVKRQRRDEQLSQSQSIKELPAHDQLPY